MKETLDYKRKVCCLGESRRGMMSRMASRWMARQTKGKAGRPQKARSYEWQSCLALADRMQSWNARQMVEKLACPQIWLKSWPALKVGCQSLTCTPRWMSKLHSRGTIPNGAHCWNGGYKYSLKKFQFWFQVIESGCKLFWCPNKTKQACTQRWMSKLASLKDR